MKKNYNAPALSVTVIEQNAPLLQALSVNNTATDNITGDVKENTGEWEDIWD